MSFTSLRSFRATSNRHRDRELTLVFGSDGQVSLIGGLTSQIPYALTASNIDPLGTPSFPSGSVFVTPIPNLEATSASFTGSSFSPPAPLQTLTSTPSSSSAPSSYDPSSTTTDTDTDLPSIPTVAYPTPSPTPLTRPKDHGVGAPFYLAIVLASISLIGCIAAFVAWYIRSRSRRRALELEDPWNHRETISDVGSPFTDNPHAFEKRTRPPTGTQTRPYYVSASIVRRSSNAHQNFSSSQTANPFPRPGADRLQTGLSVQESTRTLGRLRVANRVPGDVTSGDEGGANLPHLRSNAGLSVIADPGKPDAASVTEDATQNKDAGQNDRAVREGDGPLDPPGPATLPWGRRTDTVAALRYKRRPPGTTVKTHMEPGGTTCAYQEGNGEACENPRPDPSGWTDTLKSSFRQAVGGITDNWLDPSSRAANGSGSGFTPAPQRVASRRSPFPRTRPSTSSTLPDIATQGMSVDSTYSSSGNLVTNGEPGVPHITDVPLGSIDSIPPKVSRLNENLCASTHRRHVNTLRTDSGGSMYSNDSAAARANLRKYGYGDPIPSSWSALDAARESQLDLDRVYLSLPRPTSSSPCPSSAAPSRVKSAHMLSSMSTRARTPLQSERDFIGLGADTMQSGKHTDTSSVYSVSRSSTMQAWNATTGHGTAPSHSESSSMNASILGRKKGVGVRRKRPRLPPRAPSTASSVQSLESGMSLREVAVRRALLERRKRVKAAESHQRLRGQSVM